MELEEDSLELLVKVATDVSLRYALQLITASHLIRQRKGGIIYIVGTLSVH